jgi:hypothetical protein
LRSRMRQHTRMLQHTSAYACSTTCCARVCVSIRQHTPALLPAALAYASAYVSIRLLYYLLRSRMRQHTSAYVCSTTSCARVCCVGICTFVLVNPSTASKLSTILVSKSTCICSCWPEKKKLSNILMSNKKNEYHSNVEVDMRMLLLAGLYLSEIRAASVFVLLY